MLEITGKMHLEVEMSRLNMYVKVIYMYIYSIIGASEAKCKLGLNSF